MKILDGIPPLKHQLTTSPDGVGSNENIGIGRGGGQLGI